MTQNTGHWPPPYHIRISEKSKRILLKISAQNGLEVIIPKRGSKKAALQFLEQKRDWVEKHLLKYGQPTELKEVLPETIELKLLNQIWHVQYVHAHQKRYRTHINYPNIFIHGDTSQYSSCINILKKIIKDFAYPILSRLLRQQSQICHLPYNKLSIRQQKTRWGSCSKDGDINLNYNLIFLPEDIVKYIIIHELCHTKYLNHSKQFWALVANFVPHYTIIKRELREYEKILPLWLR